MVNRTWFTRFAWGCALAVPGFAWMQAQSPATPNQTLATAQRSEVQASGSPNDIGELAVFARTQSFSPSGYPLYTILQTSGRVPSVREVADGATWARFSADGKWLAVMKTEPSAANDTQTTSLWLMHSDGSHKTLVSKQSVIPGAWIPHTDKFVYISADGASLQAVQPGAKPKPFVVKAPAGSQIESIAFSPDGRYAAVVATVRKKANNAYDQLLLRDLVTGSQRTLLTTASPAGIILGPWAADGKSIFWWPDPAHSASLAADGLTLTQTDLNGQSRRIATTLVDMGGPYSPLVYRTVVPFGTGKAVMQVGRGRELFNNKRIGVYQSGSLHMLPDQPGKVQLSPDTNRDGSIIVFTAAPALKDYPGSDIRFNTWMNQFSLYLYNVRTHQMKQCTAAGKGIQTPLFTRDGRNILFIRQNYVMEIPSDGQEKPSTLSTLPKGLLQVADYHP